MKTCPTCGREFPDNVKFCPNDGQTLRAKGPTADLVGQVVADRYHIIKKLGEGGMGAVYLGEHVKMGRKSAIKVMAAAMAQDPDAISRFNREAANASRISHPNVCQIYDFGETPDGLIYLAMEFIEGQALTSLIEKEGALPVSRAAGILKQAADALQAAHDLTIVHRDIKPDNIMVLQGRDGSDIVKVVDFGIARAVGGDETGQKVTKTGLVVGTPEYMSPEQLSGDKLDGRSDIYSLGLVFYRMLTGVLPFQADSAQETMIKRLTDEPMPLVDARPDIVFPEELQTVLDRALARMPGERYANAAEFGRDAAKAVAGLEAPETRVDVGRASTAATQLMSTGDVEQATRAQAAAGKKAPAKKAAAAAVEVAPPPRRSALLPILGGVGAVGALAAVAVLMMKSGGSTSTIGTETAQAAANTTAAGAPAPADPRTPGRQPSPGTPAPGQPPQQAQPQPQVTPGTPPPTAPSAGPVWADTLRAADDMFEADQFASARAVASRVYAGASGATRLSAAILVAACFTQEGNTDRAIDWWRTVLRISPGHQGAINSLRLLGVENP